MEFNEYLFPRITEFTVGARLIPEKVVKMIVGNDLTKQEKELLHIILLKQEGVLAWDFTKLGHVQPEVVPL